MNNVKVSVVVPVYNTEKYLKKCLDSLVEQTLDEIEIIVVNDGSPDHSWEIMEAYADKYPQKVFAYKKKQGGLGDARNFGIERAHGEYIGFVDSDDWIDKKMFECMYDMAVKENNDVVICDYIEINDGWERGHVATGYRGVREPFPTGNYIFALNCLDPATACNKIYRASLFYIKKFPSQWYEDMATTPILLSYANKIGYLPLALYYYRQHAGSITKKEIDDRNLDVIKSWETCLLESKADYLEPIEAAVYESLRTFIGFRPAFAQQYLDFALKNKSRFQANQVIQSRIKSGQTEDIFKKKLIPKIIHYFWFGNNPKSELIEKCIASWKKYAPDFEIIEWNESNCDLHANEYVAQAYAAKKWAFVADYFRVEKLEEYGGIYMDTDMELMKSPHGLLLHPAFAAFETHDAVNVAIMGSVPHHPILRECKKSYSRSKFLNKDGTYNTSFTIVKRVTNILNKYGLVLNGQEQKLKDGVYIYPANKLTLDMFDGENIAQHHYEGSWWDVTFGMVSYKNIVLRDFFSADSASRYEEAELRTQRDYYKSEYERLENSTCWRITKPLRVVADFLKKIFRHH